MDPAVKLEGGFYTPGEQGSIQGLETICYIYFIGENQSHGLARPRLSPRLASSVVLGPATRVSSPSSPRAAVPWLSSSSLFSSTSLKKSTRSFSSSRSPYFCLREAFQIKKYAQIWVFSKRGGGSRPIQKFWGTFCLKFLLNNFGKSEKSASKIPKVRGGVRGFWKKLIFEHTFLFGKLP